LKKGVCGFQRADCGAVGCGTSCGSSCDSSSDQRVLRLEAELRRQLGIIQSLAQKMMVIPTSTCSTGI